jgi:hypothetical protein
MGCNIKDSHRNQSRRVDWLGLFTDCPLRLGVSPNLRNIHLIFATLFPFPISNRLNPDTVDFLLERGQTCCHLLAFSEMKQENGSYQRSARLWKMGRPRLTPEAISSVLSADQFVVAWSIQG